MTTNFDPFFETSYTAFCLLPHAGLCTRRGWSAIRCDQLGSGDMTRLCDGLARFFMPALFVSELVNLIAHLPISLGAPHSLSSTPRHSYPLLKARPWTCVSNGCKTSSGICCVGMRRTSCVCLNPIPQALKSKLMSCIVTLSRASLAICKYCSPSTLAIIRHNGHILVLSIFSPEFTSLLKCVAIGDL
jgi:hypothetical protein